MRARLTARSGRAPGPLRTWSHAQGYTTSLPACVRTALGTHHPSQRRLRLLMRNWQQLTPDSLTCPSLESAGLLDHVEHDLTDEVQSVLVSLLPSSMTLGELAALAERV